MKYQTKTAQYQVVGYAQANSSTYSVTTDNWRKSTCCGARRFGQSCSGCPEN